MAAVKDRITNAEFQKLRGWRAPHERDLSIAEAVGKELKTAAASQKRVSGISGAWDELVPEGLRRVCTPTAMNSGVLSVKASSAGARFQLDRWLRSGGEERLRSGGVKRVKVI